MNTNWRKKLALTTASRQLFTRSNDEVFHNWNHILTHLRHISDRSVEVGHHNITAIADENKVYALLDGVDAEYTTGMNDWSFTQLTKQTGVRGAKGTLNSVEPQTSADAINQLLQKTKGNLNKGVALIHLPEMQDPDIPTTRAFYSNRYERVSDLEVFSHFHSLSEQFGYEPAGVFAGKRGGLPPVNPEASGLYRGDRSSFGFVCNEQGKIDIDNSSLYHAVMWGNSEVGRETLWFQDVLYDFICGNHMIWGPKRVRKVKHKHTGNVRDVLRKSTTMFQEVDLERDERREAVATIHNTAIRTQFANTRELIQSKLATHMTKKDASGVLPFLDHPSAYPKNPTSYWGVSSAITLYSQTKDFTDERLALDTVAGNMVQSLAE